jgi:NAD(P)-dependent dehydrogenase (short-subunit alcohol dehydrogenase family)
MTAPAKKIALVTGANKGIGLEVTRQLARFGVTVLLGARNPALGQQAATILQAEGLDVHAIELDLTRPTTIEAAAQTIATDFGHLDILVNNAGIASPQDGLPTITTIEILQSTMQTNFIGTVAVTQAMLPLLRKASAANIVNVSSGLGSLTLASDHNWQHAPTKFLAYAASKAALNMFTVHLAYELRDTAIKVNSAEPGYTATDLNGHRGTQTIPEGAAETIRLALLPQDGPTGGYSATEGPLPW